MSEETEISQFYGSEFCADIERLFSLEVSFLVEEWSGTGDSAIKSVKT